MFARAPILPCQGWIGPVSGPSVPPVCPHNRINEKSQE